MGEIGGNLLLIKGMSHVVARYTTYTWGVDDIVQGELIDESTCLEEK